MASLVRKALSAAAGRVAEGVRVVVGDPTTEAAADAAVERLLHRAGAGGDARGRGDALLELRDLVRVTPVSATTPGDRAETETEASPTPQVAESPAAQLAVGAMGLPVLGAILRDECGDVDLVRAALEVLLNAVAAPEFGPAPTGATVAPGALNAELLARDPRHASSLLSLLSGGDFYVRYFALQLLGALASGPAIGPLRDAILGVPQGIVCIMDMLAEREVIRNEALLVLGSLAAGAAAVAQICAFEGAFDRLLAIARDEGGIGGGVLVQDALEVAASLLRASPSNVVFFHESGHVAALPPLLRLVTPSLTQSLTESVTESMTGAEPLTRQAASNVLAAISVSSLALCCPPTAAAAAASKLTAAGGLDALLSLAYGGRVTSAAIRAAAASAAVALVSASPAARAALGAACLGGGSGRESGVPAVQAALWVALWAPDWPESTAADKLLASFCGGNAEGQALLASTLAPPGGDGDFVAAAEAAAAGGGQGPSTIATLPFGTVLLAALAGPDESAACRAAGVLTHLLSGNGPVRQRLLRLPLEPLANCHVAGDDVMDSGGADASPPADRLLPRCVSQLARLSAAKTDKTGDKAGPGGGGEWLRCVLLKLLVTWLSGCPPAVAEFVAVASHVDLLGRLASSPGSGATVAGLAVVLLGVCLVEEGKTAGVGSPGKAKGKGKGKEVEPPRGRVAATVATIGPLEFLLRWEGLRRGAAYRAVSSSQDGSATRDGSSSPEAGLFDGALVATVESLTPAALAAATVHLPGAPVASLPLPTAYDGEPPAAQAAKWRAAAFSASADVGRFAAVCLALSSPPGGVGGGGGGGGVELAAALARQRDVSAEELAGHKATSQGLESKIQGLESMVAAAAAARDEARGEAAKWRADLEALSQSYNALEADCHAAQTQVQTLTQTQSMTLAGTQSGTLATTEALEAARADGYDRGRDAGRLESEADMSELLVCLGQEEAKVTALREALTARGVDPEAVLLAAGVGGGTRGAEADEAPPRRQGCRSPCG